jgi:hypothetical protein
MSYVVPEVTAVGIVKLVAFAAGETVAAPLASTSPLAVSPEIVPPTVYAVAEQVTLTLATLELEIVPVPFATEQLSPEGCVWIVTL